MPRSIRISLLLVLPAALAGLSACGSSTATSNDLGAPAGSSNQTSHGGVAEGYAVGFNNCPATATDPAVVKLKAAPAEVPLSADFHPVRAVRCTSETRAVPGDGEWQFDTAQSADSNLAPLLAALKLPSEPPPDGTRACAAVGLLMPPFALVDASGAIVRPILPLTYCGMPLPQVQNALDGLPWRTVTDQKVGQVRSQIEIDTSCSSPFKDLFEFPVMSTPIPWNKMRVPESGPPTAACAYKASGTGTDAMGTLTKGVKLTSAQQSTLSQELNRAPETAAPACSTPATRFAVLLGPNSPYYLIELDGCHRIEWEGDFKSPAPASLLSALATVGIS